MESIIRTIYFSEYLELGGDINKVDLSQMFTTISTHYAYQPLTSMRYVKEDDTFWVSINNSVEFPYKAEELCIKAKLTLYNK